MKKSPSSITNLKKLTIVFLVAIMLGIAPTFRIVHAQGAPVTDGANTAGTVAQIVVNYISEIVLQPLMSQVMSQLLNKINNSIINWVNSGFSGNPFYIDNPEEFFKNMALDSASSVAGGIRTKLNDLEKCNGNTTERDILNKIFEGDYSASEQDAWFQEYGVSSISALQAGLNATISSNANSDICNNFQSKTSERAILYSLGKNAFSGVASSIEAKPSTMAVFKKSLSTNLSELNPLNILDDVQGQVQDLQNSLAALTSTISTLNQMEQNIATSGSISSSDINTVASGQQQIISTLSTLASSVGSIKTAVSAGTNAFPNSQGLQNMETKLTSLQQDITQASSDIGSVTINSATATAAVSSFISSTISKISNISQKGTGFLSSMNTDMGDGAFAQAGESILEQFQTNFKQGGLDGYEAILLDDNATPIGKYRNTLAQIGKTLEQDTQKTEDAGQQLNETKCKETQSIKDKDGKVLSTYCVNFDVTTPKDVVGQNLAKAISSKTDSLITVSSSASPYAQIAAQVASAAIQSLATNLFTSAFTQLTDAAKDAIGLGVDEAPTPAEGFTDITDVENPFADYQDQTGATTITASLFDIDKYIQGLPSPLEIERSQLILRYDGELARSEDPFASIGQAEEVLSGNISFQGNSYAVSDAPSSAKVIRITGDPTNRIPLDYYLIDEDRYVFKIDYSLSGGTSFGYLYDQGVEKLYGTTVNLLNAQLRELSKIPEVLMEIDQQCVFGPDRGFSQRLKDHIDSASQKAKRNAQKDNNQSDDWERALDGMNEARSIALTSPDDNMFSDPFSARYKAHVDTTESWKNSLKVTKTNLSDFSARRKQLNELIYYYENPDMLLQNPNMSLETVKKQLTDIARRDPVSQSYINEIELSMERARASYKLYQEQLSECQGYRDLAFEPTTTPADVGLSAERDLTLMRKRILLDNTGALYCPWKEVSDSRLDLNPLLSKVRSEELVDTQNLINNRYYDDRSSYADYDEYKNAIFNLMEYMAQNFGIQMRRFGQFSVGNILGPQYTEDPDIFSLASGSNIYLNNNGSVSSYLNVLATSTNPEAASSSLSSLYADIDQNNLLFGDYAMKYLKEVYIKLIDIELNSGSQSLLSYSSDSTPTAFRKKISNDTNNVSVAFFFTGNPKFNEGKVVDIYCEKYYQSSLTDYMGVDQL
ncbi:hypothetical protein H6776_00220 [Candidatus Nomurabacteria bacterium]|nr:hypothetical protein [Candidatus Nomurabacteria bacterium]